MAGFVAAGRESVKMSVQKVIALWLDSLWRACLYVCHPRSWVLLMGPLLLLTVCTWALGYFFWDLAVAQLSDALTDAGLLNSGWAWLDASGWGRLKQVVAPLWVILGITPFLVMASLLLVNTLVMPSVVDWVWQRRFGDLPKRTQRVDWGVWWSGVRAVLMAILALLISLPLWLVPSMVLVLPPLIWGWLSYRLLVTTVWASCASREECAALLHAHRWALLLIGLTCGYLADLPTLIWVSATSWATAFAVLVPLAMAIYVGVFVLAGFWFTHYGLKALSHRRQIKQESSASTATLPDSPNLETEHGLS